MAHASLGVVGMVNIINPDGTIVKKPLAEIAPGFIHDMSISLDPSSLLARNAVIIKPTDVINDTSEVIALKNMGPAGFGLFLLGSVKKGQVLLYVGEQKKLDKTQGENLIYGLSINLSDDSESLVVDARARGSFARFIQHVPTDDEYSKYYLLAAGIDGQRARVNLESCVANIEGRYYFVLRFTQDVSARPDAPAFCSYFYSIERYWRVLEEAPVLFDAKGALIPYQKYCYIPDPRSVTIDSHGQQEVRNFYKMLLTDGYFRFPDDRKKIGKISVSGLEKIIGCQPPAISIFFWRDECQLSLDAKMIKVRRGVVCRPEEGATYFAIDERDFKWSDIRNVRELLKFLEAVANFINTIICQLSVDPTYPETSLRGQDYRAIANTLVGLFYKSVVVELWEEANKTADGETKRLFNTWSAVTMASYANYKFWEKYAEPQTSADSGGSGSAAASSGSASATAVRDVVGVAASPRVDAADAPLSRE